MKKKFSAFIVSLTAIVLATIMASGCSFASSSSRSDSTAALSDSQIAAQTVTFETTAKTRNIEDAFVEAVDAVKRTSVMITTETGAGSGVIVDISFDDDSENVASWKTSDSIVYILTCHHMVSVTGTSGTEGVGEIVIYIPDQNCSYYNTDYIFTGYIGDDLPSTYNSNGYAVTLVGGDFESDIALLKLDLNIAAKSGNKLSADKIEKAQIPDSTYSVKLGETVFSVGNPTGTLPGSVARGIVSYLERSTAVDEVGEMMLMQIDVSTNPGSSGGGLYNLYGELIGITNAGNTNYTNINFAIPCYLDSGNGFVEIAKQLAATASDTNYGYVSGRKVKFGFSVSEATEGGSTYLIVSSVTSGGLAASQGLKQNDVIETISVNGGTAQSVNTIEDFSAIMSALEAGQKIVLNVSRTVTGSFGRVTTQNKSIELRAENFRFCDTGK